MKQYHQQISFVVVFCSYLLGESSSMKALKAFQTQKQTWTPLLTVSYSLILIFLVTIFWIAKVQNIPMYVLVADPAEIAQKPPYMGLLSQIGILIWSGTLCVCWFTASLLGKNKIRTNQISWSEFLWSSGGVTLYLLLDDWLQIHEYTPVILGLAKAPSGVPRFLQNSIEFFVFILYFVIFAAYLWRYKGKIMQSNILPILVALGFMGLSTLIDILPHDNLRSHDLLEEGSKLIGILSWFNYFFLLSKQCLRRELLQPKF
jgi:hypothetical protein